MRKNDTADIIILASLSFIGGVFLTLAIESSARKDELLKQAENNDIHFVWNDDEESIPMPGTPIMLEMIDEETVYIGPLE